MKKPKENPIVEHIRAGHPMPLCINSYFGKETIEKAAELYERLQEPLITPIQTGINMRNLHNWVTTLGMNRGKEKHERTIYTFTEFVWLKIIEQLREAGLSLSIITELRKGLFLPIEVDFLSKQERTRNFIKALDISKEEMQELLALISETLETEHSTFFLLDVMIVQCIIRREPLGLAVFLDGSFIPVEKDYQLKYDVYDLNKLFGQTYIYVSISGIIKNFLRSDISEWVVPKINLLNPAESKLFELIRKGDYESITIEFKDKKLKSLELKKSEDIKDRIVDIIDAFEFGDITVKKHKGVVTKIESTKKIKL